MIQTLQRKFIRTAMAAVSLLLLVLLGGLNLANAWSVSRRSVRLLEELAESEREPGMRPPEDRQGFLGPPPTEDEKRAAVFFTVRVDSSGQAVRADVKRIASVTEETAAEAAEELFRQKKNNGRYQKFRYLSRETPDGSRIYFFLDVSGDRRSLLGILVLSVFAGGAGWLLMLLLVTLLSRRAIRPIAENMEKQKRFVTDAGHEIKTPLAIILANTDALELHGGETKWSRNIRRQTLRLNDLMRNLLILAKAEEERPAAGREEFSLSELLRETAESFQASMELRNLSLGCEREADIRISAEKEAFRQLISLLMDNAVKYAAPGTKITLRLTRSGGKTILQAENVCQTLPDCEPEKLFDRFYRADAARTQKNGGCGIGLSAARAIVRQQGGRIRADYGAGKVIRFTAEFETTQKIHQKPAVF